MSSAVAEAGGTGMWNLSKTAAVPLFLSSALLSYAKYANYRESPFPLCLPSALYSAPTASTRW